MRERERERERESRERERERFRRRAWCRRQGAVSRPESPGLRGYIKLYYITYIIRAARNAARKPRP